MKTTFAHGFRAALFGLAALVAAAGCSDDTVTGPAEPGADLSGHWMGTATERRLDGGVDDQRPHPCQVQSSVEVDIRQAAGQVHIDVPAQACSGGGNVVFEGTLSGNALLGELAKVADGGSCEMRGSAQGTGEAMRIVLHGAFQGPCNSVSLHLELSR